MRKGLLFIRYNNRCATHQVIRSEKKTHCRTMYKYFTTCERTPGSGDAVHATIWECAHRW